MSKNMTTVLKSELKQLEGLHGQNLETGAGIGSKTSYLDQYTNRIFGAPYQLLDSVDRRFPSINPHVGNEYLRNILLNSPILHIKPGMPYYTGRDKNLVDSIKQVYFDTSSGDMSFTKAFLGELSKSTIFNKGSQLQRRMFGFKENYYQYMQHVNYMCRSMATFLGLTTGTKFPTTVATASGMKPFKTMNWENYRMLTKTKVTNPSEQLRAMGRATVLGAVGGSIGDVFKGIYNGTTRSASEIAKTVTHLISNPEGDNDVIGAMGGNIGRGLLSTASATGNSIKDRFGYAIKTPVSEVTENKVCSVQFMVEPVQFEERFSNQVKDSMIESAMDGITSSVGSEIAFITGSNVDLGIIEGMTEFLGSTIQSASTMLAGLVEPITGGFAQNLFTGAMRSLKGQKMIYPKIYERSESHMDYQFTLNLHAPYGDVYNYYITEVVPLMHILALVGPRMITANTVASPFLVQAFIPGQCTCQLGIVTDVTVTKNPSTKHVSVHGFPLDIKVTFTITELYNSFAISPINDPSSFLYNETLNDYMANLAGLMPSADTYTQQRKSAFDNVESYFKNKEFFKDMDNSLLNKFEGIVNPHLGR